MLNYAAKYPTQIATPDTNYPLGGAQNVTSPGDGTGTPWEKDLINDIIGFFQALITETGITVSGNSETAVASDLWDALYAIYDYLNADKLIKNDTSVTPGGAFIGDGYNGKQYYGNGANDVQYYGRVANADQYYGTGANGEQYYGNDADGDQYYGRIASGDQYYGNDATGAIEVGSANGSDATKKLISGTINATFKSIIESAVPWGAWQTVAYDTGTTVPNNALLRQSIVCRKSSDGKNVQISGAFNQTSSTTATFGYLPAGYRPLNVIGVAGIKVTGTGGNTPCQISITSTGQMVASNDNNDDINFEIIIPLD